MARVTDLIKTNDFTWSVEIMPTPEATFEVVDKIQFDPVFIAITWHARNYNYSNLDIPPIKLATHLKSKGKKILMHLSCDQLKKDYLDQMLKFFKEKEICNLFIMQGEAYTDEGSEFKTTKALVEYIKKHSGDYFCIGVAGFPDFADNDEKITQLKQKLECGANFVITQAFVQFDVYQKFATKCEQSGVKVPILPGIFVYQTYDQLVRFTDFCKIKLSSSFIEYVKNNDNVSGIDITKDVAADLKKSKSCSNHIHIFTQNKFDELTALMTELIKK